VLTQFHVSAVRERDLDGLACRRRHRRIGRGRRLGSGFCQAAERARLYRETQRNAARERAVAQVGARVRASLDLEAMLRTAASEMRQALNLGDLVIRLAPPDAVSGSDEGRT